MTSVDFKTRLKNYEENRGILAKRDDAMLELVTLYNLTGDYKAASAQFYKALEYDFNHQDPRIYLKATK